MFGRSTPTTTPTAEPGGNGNGSPPAANNIPASLPSAGGNAAAALPALTQTLKIEVYRRLLENMDLAQARRMPREELQRECMRRIDALLGEVRTPLSGPEKQRLLRELMDEVFGLGPIEELLRDPMVTDILVNGPTQMYVERMGRLEPVDYQVSDD